ncbi:MAG: winged helix-turn-helix domain-containing protein [Clostridia bacterium]|nr:winged helix-turn-helix domain-containing protein [Clostridia bacterium]
MKGLIAMDTIRIQLMDNFTVYINEQKEEHLVKKSRKGVSLMQYLMLNHGQPVPNYRLLATLWTDEGSTNPENALKTLVSRLRAILNQISPDFGNCIVADRGAYHWENLPGMTVDFFRIEAIFDELAGMRDESPERIALYEELLALYKGDLLQNAEQNEWALAQATSLHNKYMSAVYSYIELLKAADNHQDIVRVCRMALNVDNFDDRLHMELMTALINTNRTNEALVQYKHVTHLNYRYLGVQPSEDMQEFYKQIVRAGKTLEFSLEAIRNELRESGEQRGAFVCEYAVFKEIYNLQMRNLERLGSTMFLGVIMVGNPDDPTMDSIKQDNIMNGTLEILKNNLRKGDTITHFSPTIFALLLPTVNYTTGNMVMERVKQLFYKKYPNSNIPFNYRIGPLSSDMQPEK